MLFEVVIYHLLICLALAKSRFGEETTLYGKNPNLKPLIMFCMDPKEEGMIIIDSLSEKHIVSNHFFRTCLAAVEQCGGLIIKNSTFAKVGTVLPNLRDIIAAGGPAIAVYDSSFESFKLPNLAIVYVKNKWNIQLEQMQQELGSEGWFIDEFNKVREVHNEKQFRHGGEEESDSDHVEVVSSYVSGLAIAIFIAASFGLWNSVVSYSMRIEIARRRIIQMYSRENYEDVLALKEQKNEEKSDPKVPREQTPNVPRGHSTQRSGSIDVEMPERSPIHSLNLSLDNTQENPSDGGGMILPTKEKRKKDKKHPKSNVKDRSEDSEEETQLSGF